MKNDRLIWGIVLLFIGTVLLLKNFGVIDFYWRNIWSFWPVFLIIAGINILFKKNNQKLGQYISISLLVVALVFLFFRGQERSRSMMSWNDNHQFDIEEFDADTDEDADTNNLNNRMNLSEPFIAADSLNKSILNIEGGGVSFKLKESTTQLIEVDLKNNKGGYTLSKEKSDSLTVLNFKNSDKNNKWSFNDDQNDVDFKLNKWPNWVVNMKLGAGEADFDLSGYKVRTLNFDGGAASLDIKLGSLLPITDVVVKSGVADVSIHVPNQSGCQINVKSGLSAKDFVGFTKVNDNLYESPNFKSAKQKVFIKLEGGLSSFTVERY